MARRGATRASDPERRPTPAVAEAPAATARLEATLVGALGVGAALSGTILYIHAQLAATSGAYTSFCNVSARVNCDAVLTSAYGMLLGVPVALWALLTYLALAALVLVRGRVRPDAQARATLLLFAIALWSLVFSVYMAAIAAFALRTLCLLCSGLYLVNVAIAVLAWRLARSTTPGGPLTTRQLALGAGVTAVALATVAGLQLRASSAAIRPLTADEIAAQQPEFYKWYASRPVVDALPAVAYVRGPADAAVTIVEFSDFECGFCAKAFRDLRDLEQRHGGMLKIAFHHFPLDPDCNAHVTTRIHRFACQAAIAAECAAQFDKFWEYHDRLFQNQERLGPDDLVATAVDLGIDRAAFTACLADPAAKQRVVADAAAGARLGVKSTPTLFINRRTVEGAPESGAYEWILALERRG